VNKKRNIIDLESSIKQANDLFTDIKTEIVAAGLIEQGYDPNRILITREGASRRNWNKDIEDLYLEFSQFDLKDYLHIKSNRASIYDILPEGMFHKTSQNRLQRDKEDVIDEIKLHRREEFFARRFFQLFEVEIDSQTTKAYVHEAKYDKKISNNEFTNIFLSYWPILRLLKREQAIFFLHTIPLLNKIRNKFEEAAEAMSLILDTPVKIEPVKIQHKDEGNEINSNLGNNRLGIDWVLGNSFDDGLFDIKVTLGPLCGEEMRNYLGEENGSKILDYLCRLLLPGNVFVIKDYIIVQKEAQFRLSDENYTSYLGINSFL